jgi:hypothetical protein
MQTAAIPFPDGWFTTSCRPLQPQQSWFLNLELSRSLAVMGSSSAETTAKNPCPALGYLLLDPAQRAIKALRFPGAGQANAQGNNGDLNDYLFATNSDSNNPNQTDTLYVLDGVSETAIRFNLPTSVATFSGLQTIPEMGALMGLANNRIAGDAGVVFFNLDEETGKVLPVPDGFQRVALLGGGNAGFFASTRKLVVRGFRPNNEGSSLIVYDLATDDSYVVANPDGVVHAGQLPAQAAAPGSGPPGGGPPPGGGGPGGAAGGGAAPQPIQAINPKSNFVAVVGYNGDRQAVGVMAVRIP